MRVLCLHGVGSSGTILETQLRPFLQAVDSSYEFIFVDGPIASPRGPGVSPDIDGPFFSHTTGYSAIEMGEAFAHLEDTIEELGPFDGVLGFSQGGALLTSYMHRQQELRNPLPFGFALILSSVLPCSADQNYLQGVFDKLSDRRLLTMGPAALASTLSGEERIFLNLLMHTIIPAKENRAMLPDIDLNAYTDDHGHNAPRIMHSQLLKERIRIPTVHVTGRRDYDFMRNMSEAAFGLCDERMTKKLQHSGSHHPPMKPAEVQSLVRAMDWAVRQSQKFHGVHL